MKIAIGCDHGGIVLKDTILQILNKRNIEFVDCGCFEGERVDYPTYAAKVARLVQSGQCERGIVMCGTGIGISVAANKFRGIRATLCHNAFTAEMSRRHNNSNCLALGGRDITTAEAEEITQIWLDTPFEGDRHSERLALINDMEVESFK